MQYDNEKKKILIKKLLIQDSSVMWLIHQFKKLMPMVITYVVLDL